MARIKEGDPCPQCREGKVYRLRRRGWMRWIPKGRRYKCKRCQAGYLTIWFWTLKLKAKKKPEPEEE